MAITLKQIKKGNKFKPLSKLSKEEKDFFFNYKKKKREETIKLEKQIEKYNKLSTSDKIISPMYLPLRMKANPDKKISLNMNWYRNVGFIQNDQMKKLYKSLLKEQFEKLGHHEKLHFHYVIYYGKNIPDGMNVVSVISKFLLDALQDYNVIKDDNLNIVTESYEKGSKDIGNERVEIFFKKT